MQLIHSVLGKKPCYLPLLVGLAASALPALATEPLYVRNMIPVSGLLGMPSQRDAQAQDRGSLGVALHGSIANTYVLDASGSEYLNLDGETGRFALELRYGLLENWDLQLEVPWLDQSGGHLDKLIDDWHDLWGMPDGGRSDVPRDLLDYRYANIEGAGFSLRDSASGLGDISLSLNYAFYRDDGATASVLLGYKFDTGDEDEFLGSGAGDSFAGVRFSGADMAGLPLRWHGQLGYLRAGSSDLLEGIQERNLWFAGLGLDWVLAERWSLLAQLDSHAAPTDSNISALGDNAIMLALGARWRFAPSWSVDVSMVEDIQVETAADIAFQATLRYTGR
jgi:Protein of unknown function (DUF3187)